MDFYLQWKSCFARVQRDHLDIWKYNMEDMVGCSHILTACLFAIRFSIQANKNSIIVILLS